MRELSEDSQFKAELEQAGNKLVVVDFFATWCGPCHRIAPFLEEMSKKFTDVVFFKVDVDKLEDTAHEEGISAMPTFKFYLKKKCVDSIRGADQDGLEKKITELAAKAAQG